MYLADNAIYTADYNKAKTYYLKALSHRPDNYNANLGMAILLTDYIENYDNSLPYLEKALKLNPKKDTAPALMFALGRNFQYLGKYDSAIYYFQKLKRYEDIDDKMFEKKLTQNIADCNYAKENNQTVSATKWYVVNAGNTINTDMPEYVPVLTGNNQMIFTSKRKDDEKEKFNLYNGQYFEAMYIAHMHNGRTTAPKLFTIPKSSLISKLSSSDESVISMLPDGKEMFLYKNGKIYQGDLTASLEHPKKLDKIINFDYYQNHASLSKDGQTLYFTSESAIGNGGNDIYKSVKKQDGSWGVRENLGKVINTEFDEESPFIADDGKTLYFSSKGHVGYGGFDIFKTVYENGKWSTPENLGLPINSSANDIFFIINAAGNAGYFSSSRAGGLGDYDIYKINFMDKYLLDCNSPEATTLNIDASSKPGERNKFILSAQIPGNMKDKVISFNWLVNDSIISEDSKNIEYDFKAIGNYKVKAKLMAWCDTCLNPYIACSEKNVSVQTVESISTDVTSNLNVNDERNIDAHIAEAESLNKIDLKTGGAKTKTTKAEKEKAAAEKSEAAKESVLKESPLKKGGTNAEALKPGIANYYSNELKDIHGELTKEQTAKLGLDIQPVYFDFNHTELKAEAITKLDNIKTVLTAFPDLTLIIVGHTDSKGTKKNNQLISVKRAVAVKNYIVKGGFDKTKTITKGRGEIDLVNKCADHVKCDEAQHQQNRRVEIKIIKR